MLWYTVTKLVVKSKLKGFIYLVDIQKIINIKLHDTWMNKLRPWEDLTIILWLL